VGSVSEKLIAQSKAESGRAYSVSVHNAKGLIVSKCTAFDPKPFIRTFEAAVDNLIAIRKDVQAKTEKQEKSVQVAEREYSKKMIELNKGFEVCMVLSDSPQASSLSTLIGCWRVILRNGE
jgi:hypothetical protein